MMRGQSATLSFAETFFGSDQEILQHKFYGLLVPLTVGEIELLRRLGQIRHPAWVAPLLFLCHDRRIAAVRPLPWESPGSRTRLRLHHAIIGARWRCGRFVQTRWSALDFQLPASSRKS